MSDIKELLGKTIKACSKGEETEGLVIMVSGDLVYLYTETRKWSTVGSHVDKEWCVLHDYYCVDNITDYHNKNHVLINSRYWTYEILNGQPVEQKHTGCSCSACGQFNNMAEPNQPDNTFKCYSCRVNPLRIYY